MVSKTPIRSLQQLARRQRQVCTCQRPIRQFSTSRDHRQEPETQQERPRWAYTPPAMQAPFQHRIKDPVKAWESNSDPRKLDAMYVKLLGNGGEQVLSDETRWLAITHKSFDQGRRGFNDKLAYFGKQLLVSQAQIALLDAPKSRIIQTDAYERTPFTHPALAGLSNLTAVNVSSIVSKERLSNLARQYGIDTVTRWKPRNPQDMEASGCDVVFSMSLYAIIGAISLEKGNAVANKVVKENVLRQLGI